MIKFDLHLFSNPVSKKNFDPPPPLSTPQPKEKFRPPPPFGQFEHCLWNDLPPELRTISLPPAPSLSITRHHLQSPPLSVTPGLSLKLKMSSLQTLLP